MRSGEPGFNYQTYLNQILDGYEDKTKKVFGDILGPLRGTIKDPRAVESIEELAPKPGNPEAVVCLDQARHLLSEMNREVELLEEPDMRFTAFIRATRHQTSVQRPIDGHNTDNNRFFALLLDTTSRVSSFAPPREHDPTKFLRREELFPPIYQIHTFDLFKRNPDRVLKLEKTIDVKALFCLGRPMWGAYLEAGQSLKAVQRLALEKIGGGPNTSNWKGGRDVHLIALISFRILFQLRNQTLADELTSGCLRFIYDIDDERRSIRTKQPSEPILAHVSAMEMKRDRVKRVDAIKTLYQNVNKRTIHLGDTGEYVAALIFLFAFDKIRPTKSSCQDLSSSPHSLPLSSQVLCPTAFKAVWKKTAN